MIKVKRVYDPAENEDGLRILVDRLWPRGLSKGKAKLGLWLKEIAPSDSLRKWFRHDPKKWDEFKKKYHHELQDKQDLLQQIRLLEKEHRTVTLLYGAKDTEHNQAVVLVRLLQ